MMIMFVHQLWEIHLESPDVAKTIQDSLIPSRLKRPFELAFQ